MRKKYASRLTKERLLKEGFTEITKEGRLFKGDREVFPVWNGKESNPNRYLYIQLHQRDEEGHLIKGKPRIYKYKRKDGSIGESISWQAKSDTFGLHRVMWAWHYGEVPEGMVVDHINNKHLRIEDYHLDNLQLLTPKQNINKERTPSTRQQKCDLSKPRSFYEAKLAQYEAEYELAKFTKDPKRSHKLRSYISQYRARLRYYDEHQKEATELLNTKREEEAMKLKKKKSIRDRKILEQYKEMFRKSGNTAMWHEVLHVIRVWDTLEEVQQEHVFETLHKYFGKD